MTKSREWKPSEKAIDAAARLAGRTLTIYDVRKWVKEIILAAYRTDRKPERKQ